MSDYFNFEKLEIRSSYLYLWTDYVELYCLQNNDTESTFDEILDERLDSQRGLGAIGLDPDEDIMEEDDFDDEENIKATIVRDSRTEKFLADLKNHLKMRSELFGDSYPFEVGDGLIIKREQTKDRLLYSWLLCAANSRLLNDSKEQKFYRDSFEVLARLTLSFMLSERFTTLHFGTADTGGNGILKAKSQKIIDKIDALAELLNCKNIITDNERNRLNNSTGDGGLDFFAYLDFEDRAAHHPLILAQAGCSCNEEEIFKKLKSVTQERWMRKLSDIVVAPIYFTPVCYRDASGLWPQPSEILSMFLDRSRIMRILEGVPATAENILCFQQKESLIWPQSN